VLAASDSFAGPLPNADRPAYSYLLLGALRGWADENGDKAVDVDEAHEFTRSHIQRLFKGSDRLPSKRGPSVVLAKNVREKQPDIAALVSGKCPSGSTWDGRECKQQATVECPAGTTWNGTACVSRCPAGTSWNGRACAATTIECPAGTSWNGSMCAATTVECPEDTMWKGSACEDAKVPVLSQLATGAVQDGKRAGETRQDGRGINWVWMPSGSFHHGCEPQDKQCNSNEERVQPWRTLGDGAAVVLGDFAPGVELHAWMNPYRGLQRSSVQGFWMMQTETTVAAYKTCADADVCPSDQLEVDTPTKTCNGANGRLAHPMNCVDWSSATAFCRFVGGRLPTAVEWEYAAKSGSSRVYPWGDDAVTGRRANFCDANCATALQAADKEKWQKNGWINFGEDDGWAGTAPVGSMPGGETVHGLKDMAGNVSEWTASDYGSSSKEMRGGSWHNDPSYLRASSRSWNEPAKRNDNIGFRCALGGLSGASTGDAGGAGGLGSRGTSGSGGTGLGIGRPGSGTGRGSGGSGNIDLGGRAKGTPKIVPGKIVYEGGLSREEIQRVISRVMSEIKYCYERELNKDPNLEGKLVMSWLIGGSGDVQTASAPQNTFSGSSVQPIESCVKRIIQRLKFPSPRGGGVVKVTYPFVFANSGG
jgi:formylglycine-generating enzyme required for sulfatase activity